MGLAKHKHGLKNMVTAAALWQSPTIFGKASENIKTALWGMVDKNVGRKLKSGLIKNEKYLTPSLQQNYKVNLPEVLKLINGVTDIDLYINWKTHNEPSLEAYQKNYSCSTYFDKFQVPTFVYFSEDDPIINKSCIGFENARSNENILIASNKYGSHLCNFEHFFTVQQYLPKPAFEFFDYFLKTDLNLPSGGLLDENKYKMSASTTKVEDDFKIDL